jgi:hypothetical protein
MNHLVLYVDKNSEGKHDGDEFRNEANAYAAFHRERFSSTVNLLRVPCELPALRRPERVEAMIVGAALPDNEEYDVFAYFGHGTERWIQTAHTTVKPGNLARALARVLCPEPMLWFAACKTAALAPNGGPGFLQTLVAQLHERITTAHAWGHTTAGHTTRNPNLCLITPFERECVSKVQMAILKKRLWEPTSELRFWFPLCTSIEGLLA